MGFKIPNPLTWVSEKINTAIDKQFEDEENPGSSTAPVPANPAPPAPVLAQAQPPATTAGDGQEQTIVTGRFIEQGQSPGAGELHTESTRQTERFMHIVEKFDEDRQEPIEWLIRKGASLFCYVAPFALAVPIGLAVGDAFTPPNTTGAMPLAIHMLSIFLEIIMPILGLAATVSFKRAIKDRAKMAGAVFVSALFVLVSVSNALALLFLLEKNGISVSDPATFVGVAGRSFGSFIIDVGSSIYLTVSGVKSLAKYLADQRAKIVAVRDVNTVHIEMEQTQIKAAIDRQTAIMDMQSKASRASTWNEIEKMQSQAMIEQARRNMKGEGDGYRRSSW